MIKNNWFEKASPESQGIPSSAILAFIEEVERERIGIDALIIMRHEKIVAEGYWAPFERGEPHRMFSSAKAIVAAAILFAIDDGLLRLDDVVTNFFEDSMPEGYSDRFDRMTIYDMLTMHTGHVKDPLGIMVKNGGDRENTFFHYAPEFEPGTHFMYNNGVPDMLGIILYKLTGKRVLEYLENKLFVPLGMDGMNAERYRHLDELPTMTSSTRSLLKLAYLFANHGVWDGKQLISRWLADMAGACLVPSLQDPEPPMVAYDTKFGYGFQIWRNSVGGFRIDGGRGQFGIAIPDLDLVIAINATEQDQQILPLLVWKHITNHMYAKPIKEDPETYERLTKKLENLTWAEAGEKLPIPALAGEYVLDKEMIGTKRITVDIASDGTVAVGTDATDELVAFGVCNSGQWSSTSNPFVFEPVRFGSGIGRNSVVGGDLNTTFGCVLCRETGKLEFHIRSKGFMGCKIVEIDSAVGMLRLIPYEDFARQCRSSAVKHPDLDITARDGIQRVKITKL